MDQPPLYSASVPVLRHYLAQVQGIVDKASAEALNHAIGDSFPARQQFTTAAGFAMRATCPLIGRDVPDLPAALAPRLAVVRATLGTMRPDAFAGAEQRMIQHRAGFADVVQSGGDYLHLFAMPNFFFHLTMGYAALRLAGVTLGKADFDGLHLYPADFRFPG